MHSLSYYMAYLLLTSIHTELSYAQAACMMLSHNSTAVDSFFPMAFNALVCSSDAFTMAQFVSIEPWMVDFTPVKCIMRFPSMHSTAFNITETPRLRRLSTLFRPFIVALTVLWQSTTWS